MCSEVITISGNRPGPISIILAGVHGDEVCGIEAFKHILSNLKIDSGSVMFVYGNPRAIEQGVRFTEANLNRLFRDDKDLTEFQRASYEYARAQELKGYLDRAEVLLDLHASYTPTSTSFVICDDPRNPILQYLPQNLLVTGLSTIVPGGSDYYMIKQGKVGICVECGYLSDPESTQIAIKTMFAFFCARNHTLNKVSLYPKKTIVAKSLYKTKTSKFILSKPFADFEQVKPGQTIGLDGAEEVVVSEEGVILFARNCNRQDEEAFVFGVIQDV